MPKGPVPGHDLGHLQQAHLLQSGCYTTCCTMYCYIDTARNMARGPRVLCFLSALPLYKDICVHTCRSMHAFLTVTFRNQSFCTLERFKANFQTLIKTPLLTSASQKHSITGGLTTETGGNQAPNKEPIRKHTLRSLSSCSETKKEHQGIPA